MNRKNHRAHPVVLTLLALAVTSFSASSSAGLGGDENSIRLDSTRLGGQWVRTSLLQYERHDITSSAGGTVHEYLSRSGKVFAVSWQARLPPDLRQLFGSYFEPLRAAEAAQTRPGAHRQVAIVQPDFVYLAAGNARAFQGRAYVPSLVPAGLDVSSLP
jgi:hypothetical protein